MIYMLAPQGLIGDPSQQTNAQRIAAINERMAINVRDEDRGVFHLTANAWRSYHVAPDNPSLDALSSRLRSLSERLEAAKSRHGMVE
jgi:hypothetical protein